MVTKLVVEGWPVEKRGTPVCALPYFDVRDYLSAVNGILVKGETVVIPHALRPSIKRRLHSAHGGRDSMLRCARGTVYWPSITSDIKQIAESVTFARRRSHITHQNHGGSTAMVMNHGRFVLIYLKSLESTIWQWHTTCTTPISSRLIYECAYRDIAEETFCSL